MGNRLLLVKYLESVPVGDVLTFDYGAMDVDFKDFYSEALNQVPWESQKIESCTPISQVPLAS